ncbi:hypothetical protein TNCV_3425901 [Trichonephila clavipes]|nr:hypothetical protein TNCV_3425901 [Trichonephila clavipes]
MGLSAMLHQVTKYVKRLEIALSMNVRQGIGFENSGREICPFVINHEHDDEALQAAIKEDSSQMCGELARQFNTSNETVRIHLHRLVSSVPWLPIRYSGWRRIPLCRRSWPQVLSGGWWKGNLGGISQITPGVVPQNWGGNEPNRTVPCMVLD